MHYLNTEYIKEICFSFVSLNPPISATTCTSQGTKVGARANVRRLFSERHADKKLDCDKLLGNKVQRSNES